VDADAERSKGIGSLLESWALETRVIPDGGDALLELHRARPDLVVLGANLPGVKAPAIAEILRRNADLQELPLIRVTTPNERSESPEFDADCCIEPGDCPEGLAALLEELGVGQNPAASERAAPPAPKPAPAAARPAAPPKPAAPKPAAAPAPKAAAPASGSSDPEVKAAERLARIVVSDIVLYNEEKFAQGAADGNVAELLVAELQEAGAMFRQRVSEELRAERDFLVEELERRAEKQRASS
jgi:CheY-like chemotaxis protein